MPINYKIAQIRKGKHSFRSIYIPDAESKAHLKSFLPYLRWLASDSDPAGVNYAFVKHKNAVLNAFQHIGKQYCLSFDLMDFFDTVNRTHVASVISDEILSDCLVDGAPRQGFPTSPLIATIAFYRCDQQIMTALKALQIDCVYTRYADDLMFSFNRMQDAGKIRFLVEQVVTTNGFKLNKRKTRFQSARNGRIVITGVALDKDGVYATRKTRKKLRAATHQGNKASTKGLKEWAMCRLPRALLDSDIQ